MAIKRPEDAVADATVHHQIHLSRLAAGIRNRASALYVQALREYADDVERLDIGSVQTRQQLHARLDSLESQLSIKIDRANQQIEAELRDLAEGEAGFFSRLWGKFFGGV